MLPSSNELITALGIPPSLSPLPPSFPLPAPYDLFLLSSSPSDFVLLFLLVPLFLLAFLAPSFSLSLVVPPLSSSLSSAGRRRPDERDNSSSIRLSAATLFLVFFRLRFFFFFYPYLPFAKTLACYRGRESKCSLQLQSGAMHSKDASTRRSLIGIQGDGDKEFESSSFLSSLAAFYALYLSNEFNFARLAFPSK